jgi:hypothetical protein
MGLNRIEFWLKMMANKVWMRGLKIHHLTPAVDFGWARPYTLHCLGASISFKPSPLKENHRLLREGDFRVGAKPFQGAPRGLEPSTLYPLAGGHGCEIKKPPPLVRRWFPSGREWTRTIDLTDVNRAL